MGYRKPGRFSMEEFRDCIYEKVSKRKSHIKFNDQLLWYERSRDDNDTSPDSKWTLQYLLDMCIKYTHVAQAETNQMKLDTDLGKPPKLLGLTANVGD